MTPDVRSGGHPEDAPGPWDDQDETPDDDAAELAGAPAQPAEEAAASESGQDSGSMS